MTGGLVRGGKLNKIDEMERRRGRFNWLLFFLPSFFSFFSQVGFSFPILLSHKLCLRVRVPHRVSGSVAGGVVEGLVKVEQDI